MKLFFALILISFAFLTNAADLKCKATKILSEGKVKLGDQIIFNASKTKILRHNKFVDDCEMAPDLLSDFLGALSIVGCEENSEKRDVFYFNNDKESVELLGVAVFTCHNRVI
jgi:hypothetical protein